MRLPVFVAAVLILAGCGRQAQAFDGPARLDRELARAVDAGSSRDPAPVAR